MPFPFRCFQISALEMLSSSLFTGVLFFSPYFTHMDVPSLVTMDENIALDASQAVEISTPPTGEKTSTPKGAANMKAIPVAIVDSSATPDQESTKEELPNAPPPCDSRATHVTGAMDVFQWIDDFLVRLKMTHSHDD